MTTPTLAQVELQLAGWRISSNDGAKITFWLPDEADLEPFKQLTERRGKTSGQRLMAVFVEIGDDETPVQQESSAQSEQKQKWAVPDRAGNAVVVSPAERAEILAGTTTAEEIVERRKVGFAKDIGPLAQWAVLRCADEKFQRWIVTEYGDTFDEINEANAKRIILAMCGVTSRKQLDTDPAATEAFHEHIRQPYAAIHAEG